MPDDSGMACATACTSKCYSVHGKTVVWSKERKERSEENLTLEEFGFRFSTELRLRLLPLVLMRGKEKLEPGDLTGAKLPKATPPRPTAAK